jgi:Tol biopolymer transport system component
MDPDGSNLQRLTRRPGFQPDWSPDGSRIVFGSLDGHDGEVFVMNADGSDLIRLTRNRFEETLPAWSPDGLTIAFASRRDRNTDIYLMNAEGSDQVRLTHSRPTT